MSAPASSLAAMWPPRGAPARGRRAAIGRALAVVAGRAATAAAPAADAAARGSTAGEGRARPGRAARRRRAALAVGAVVAWAALAAPAPARAQLAEAQPRNRAATSMGAPFPVPGVNALIAPTGVELLSAAAGANSAGAAQFFASFTPSQVHDWRYVPFASDAKITISTDTSTSLTRFALSTGYSPFALRGATDGSRMLGIIRTTARRLQDGWYTIHGKNCADILSATLTDDEAAWCNQRRLADEWPLVFHTWIPAISITGAVDVFPYGSVPDMTDPAQRVALEPYGGVEGQLTLVFRPREWVELDLMGSASRKRPTGAPHTPLASYYGGALTPSFLVWSWLDRSRIDRFGDYVKLGFIPGLALGASLQALWCPNGSDCVSGKTFDLSVSPFVDVRIKAQLQVRLSVPIEYFETAPRKDTAVAPTLTLAGAIGSP